MKELAYFIGFTFPARSKGGYGTLKRSLEWTGPMEELHRLELGPDDPWTSTTSGPYVELARKLFEHYLEEPVDDELLLAFGSRTGANWSRITERDLEAFLEPRRQLELGL